MEPLHLTWEKDLRAKGLQENRGNHRVFGEHVILGYTSRTLVMLQRLNNATQPTRKMYRMSTCQLNEVPETHA